MTRSNFIKAVLILWVVFFVWSFVYFFITEPTGDSFVRGLNRVSGFFRWHLVAIILTAISWTIGGKLAPGTKLRKIRLIPVVVEFSFAFLIMAIILYFALIKPEPDAGEMGAPNPVPTEVPAN